jgi:hypothetical protein
MTVTQRSWGKTTPREPARARLRGKVKTTPQEPARARLRGKVEAPPSLTPLREALYSSYA